MSENNNELIIAEPEVLPAEPYDLDFITLSLGLIPICNGDVAINPASITDMEKGDEGNWSIRLINEQEYVLDDADMTEFERALKGSIEKNKAKVKEGLKERVKMEAEVMAELQGGVQPGMILGAPTGRRFRQ